MRTKLKGMTTVRRLHSADSYLSSGNLILAGEWHPEKNDGLAPEHVTLMSNQKVWWLCKKGMSGRLLLLIEVRKPVAHSVREESINSTHDCSVFLETSRDVKVEITMPGINVN